MRLRYHAHRRAAARPGPRSLDADGGTRRPHQDNSDHAGGLSRDDNAAAAAKVDATLDRITGGRFAINVVSGSYQKEFELFSNGNWIAPSEARYNRMNEFV